VAKERPGRSLRKRMAGRPGGLPHPAGTPSCPGSRTRPSSGIGHLASVRHPSALGWRHRCGLRVRQHGHAFLSTDAQDVGAPSGQRRPDTDPVGNASLRARPGGRPAALSSQQPPGRAGSAPGTQSRSRSSSFRDQASSLGVGVRQRGSPGARLSVPVPHRVSRHPQPLSLADELRRGTGHHHSDGAAAAPLPVSGLPESGPVWLGAPSARPLGEDDLEFAEEC
jgi:hypothetical protein